MSKEEQKALYEIRQAVDFYNDEMSYAVERGLMTKADQSALVQWLSETSSTLKIAATDVDLLQVILAEATKMAKLVAEERKRMENQLSWSVTDGEFSIEAFGNVLKYLDRRGNASE